MQSGIVWEGLGLLEWSVPSNEAALDSFREACRKHGMRTLRESGLMAIHAGLTSIEEVVLEIAATTITERGETRADDRVSEAAMEDRKKAGYF